MKYRILILSFLMQIVLSSFCFCEEKSNGANIKIIEKESYVIQIKQNEKKYPKVLYVIFKDIYPDVESVKKILKAELLSLAKKENKEINIIASAWFNDGKTDALQKIKLSEKYGSLVWAGSKTKSVMTFPEYLNFLKKEKLSSKKTEKS